MKRSDARAMLAPAGEWGGEAEQWADLGCGRGTFTLALAELLGPGSTIVAVDEDRSALRALPVEHDEVRIQPRRATLRTFEPDTPLHGILMANALHYDEDPAALLNRLARLLAAAGRILLVEYDTDTPLPPWVPYPVSRHRARALFDSVGFTKISDLASRSSVYGRSPLYAMVASGWHLSEVSNS